MMELSKATEELAKQLGTFTGNDYQRLRREVDRTKASARNAQRAYENHIATHGCDVLKAST
jgi:hypothetical protein